MSGKIFKDPLILRPKKARKCDMVVSFKRICPGLWEAGLRESD